MDVHQRPATERRFAAPLGAQNGRSPAAGDRTSICCPSGGTEWTFTGGRRPNVDLLPLWGHKMRRSPAVATGRPAAGTGLVTVRVLVRTRSKTRTFEKTTRLRSVLHRQFSARSDRVRGAYCRSRRWRDRTSICCPRRGTKLTFTGDTATARRSAANAGAKRRSRRPLPTGQTAPSPCGSVYVPGARVSSHSPSWSSSLTSSAPLPASSLTVAVLPSTRGSDAFASWNGPVTFGPATA